MKNIAVLVKELTTAYNFTVLEGIQSYFQGKDDVRFVISSLCQPDGKEHPYDYQYWTAIDILKSPDIDAVIIITNSFLTSMKLTRLTEELSVFAGKPVFSVATPLNLEKAHYTHTICSEAYFDVVKHLVERHGRKRIAFFSAGLIDSPDSDERLEAYKAALLSNGLPYDPSLVYKGDFTPGTANRVLDELFQTKEEVPFDAMLCANDFTAGGCLLSFLRLGIKVPEDVSLFGFDNDSFATLTSPTLSSIDQSVEGSGAKVAEMAWRYLNGEQVDEVAVIQSSPIYRQSCGCISTGTDTTAFIDAKGTYHGQGSGLSHQAYKLLSDKLEQTASIDGLIETMNTRLPFSELVQKNIKFTQGAMRMTDLYVTLYDNPLHCAKYSDFFLSDSARLVLCSSLEKGVRIADLSDKAVRFNPREHIVPLQFLDAPAGKYFLQSMSMQEANYGYILCRLENSDNTVISVNLKLLTNVLIQSIEYQYETDQKKQLISHNQTLNLQSKTDELTQILNRRGFFDAGQQLVNLSVATGKTGAVFFCDLDGLKKINDTYGHKTGDLAIKTEAQVLKALFRESDMVGRLSGDEFGVVAPGMKLKFVPKMRERLLELNKKFSEEAGLPFTLSISLGPIEFDQENSDLGILLSQADEMLYLEKSEKHGAKK